MIGKTALLLLLLCVLGARSFDLWGAVLGPLLGLSTVLLLPRALASRTEFDGAGLLRRPAAPPLPH